MTLEWRAAPDDLELRADEVHVWRVDMPDELSDLDPARALISPHELTRAERFRFERDRIEYVVSHAALRRLLGRFTGLDPHTLVFDKGVNGKPALRGSPAVRFNLSHSGGVALIALAREVEVGVDVELVNAERALDGIASRVMTVEELAVWRAKDRTERVPLFFRVWTAKEALMKATGRGLGLEPRTLTVLASARALVHECEIEGQRYELRPIDVGEEWSAALATAGDARSLRTFVAHAGG